MNELQVSVLRGIDNDSMVTSGTGSFCSWERLAELMGPIMGIRANEVIRGFVMDENGMRVLIGKKQ